MYKIIIMVPDLRGTGHEVEAWYIKMMLTNIMPREDESIIVDLSKGYNSSSIIEAIEHNLIDSVTHVILAPIRSKEDANEAVKDGLEKFIGSLDNLIKHYNEQFSSKLSQLN